MPPAPRSIALPRLTTPQRDRLEAVIALVDAAERVVRLAERTLGEHGMTLPQFDVLSNLVTHDGLTQNGLAERLQVTKGNVCGLLDRLERAAYVRRRPDEHDARVNRLSATAAGRRAVETLRPLHDAALLDWARDWTAADVAAVHAACRKIRPVAPNN